MILNAFVDAPWHRDTVYTSWRLTRSGQTLTCVLLRQPHGEYILRLTHGDQRILDERCDSPQHALTRSLDALGALLACGWMHEGASN